MAHSSSIELHQSSSNGRTTARSRLGILLILALSVAVELAAAEYNWRQKSNYDPEKELDGIPVFSASSSEQKPNSVLDFDNIDFGIDKQRERQLKRRNSDPDLEDASEDDDDEDEFQSGSDRRDNYENPAFGESRAAARDAEDIEVFFDRHLGPPSGAGGREQDEVGSSSEPRASRDRPQLSRELPRSGDSSDDADFDVAASSIFSRLKKPPVVEPQQEEAAAATATAAAGAAPSPSAATAAAVASSALSNIFQAFLNHAHTHHGLPLVHIQTSDGQPTAVVAAAEADGGAGEQPTAATTTSNNLAALSSPAAFVVPIGAPNTPVGDTEPSEPESSGPPAASPLSGIQEIYIGRGPVVRSYLQQAASSKSRQQQQQPTSSASSLWPSGRMAHTQMPLAEQQRYLAWRQQQRYQQPQFYAPMGLPYPVAAAPASGLSHAESENNQEQEQGSDAGDQTVTYNLSFGGADGAQAAADSDADEPQESSGTDETDAQSSSYPMQHFRVASSNAYNNNQNVGRLFVQQAAAQPQLQLQQPKSLLGARYHVDPSELPSGQRQSSGTTGGPYKGPEQHSRRANHFDSLDRQQLIAHLDQQIKRNPHYRQQNAALRLGAAASQREAAHRPSGHSAGDLDSYSSLHVESDPYKLYTRTMKLVDARHRPASENPNLNLKLNQNQNSSTSDADDQLRASELKVKQLAGSIKETTSDTQSARDDAAPPASSGAAEQKWRQIGTDGDESRRQLSRVRRSDSDERDNELDDDDGVWVDDDDDQDEGRHQSSDVNESAQEPDDEAGDQSQGDDSQPASQYSGPPPPAGFVGRPHGYELAPNVLLY